MFLELMFCLQRVVVYAGMRTDQRENTKETQKILIYILYLKTADILPLEFMAIIIHSRITISVSPSYFYEKKKRFMNHFW